jgi:hypothetical protein
MAKGPWVGPNNGGGGTPTNPTVIPTWMKFSFTHLNFQAASLTNTYEIYSAPSRVNILGAVLKHSIQFAGTGITDYKLSVGLLGDLARYVSLFDVDTAPSDTKPAGYAEGYFGDTLNFGAVTSIRIAAVAVGANLNQSTAGAGNLWLLVSRLEAP